MTNNHLLECGLFPTDIAEMISSLQEDYDAEVQAMIQLEVADQREEV